MAQRSPAAQARRAAANHVCCSLGEALANHREAAGFTQDHLAAAVGVTQHMVSYWETGRALMGTHHLLLVAARLCIPAEVFVADAWADAAPCARLLVPPPAGDPVLIRWRRPPPRPRPKPIEAPDPPPTDLVGRLRAAGLPATVANWAAIVVDDLGVCEVGWRKGDCRGRPTRVAVRVNRTRRWDNSPARIVARTLCSAHADRLDDAWVVVDLPTPDLDEECEPEELATRRVRSYRSRR